MPPDLGPRDQFVAGQPAPRGQVLFDRGLGGRTSSNCPAFERVDVVADQQQQAVAAVEVAAVEADDRRIRVVFAPVHWFIRTGRGR